MGSWLLDAPREAASELAIARYRLLAMTLLFDKSRSDYPAQAAAAPSAASSFGLVPYTFVDRFEALAGVPPSQTPRRDNVRG